MRSAKEPPAAAAIAAQPVLVLAARICPEGVEATLFATLMSILNGGAFLGSAFGSALTKASRRRAGGRGVPGRGRGCGRAAGIANALSLSLT